MSLDHRLYFLCSSNHDFAQSMDRLRIQMQHMNSSSGEYLYDSLHLQSEEIEYQIRLDHPELNPLTQQGAQAIDALVDQNPQTHLIDAQINQMKFDYSDQVSSWGIPMASWSSSYSIAC